MGRLCFSSQGLISLSSNSGVLDTWILSILNPSLPIAWDGFDSFKVMVDGQVVDPPLSDDEELQRILMMKMWSLNRMPLQLLLMMPLGHSLFFL
ncbi:hypothetical protein RJT34_02854 [Clitoria ternatea]|uniref:Uncharacterized protein n=1 Tax=Clitoria ternatea TaxID=43366 RepID=A0AAN9PZ97_CLITE